MAQAARARVAVALIFFLHGILVGGWAPQVPLAKERLDVGPALFGWVLLAMAAGGVVAMPIAGALINRFGSAALCRACGVAMALAFLLPAQASHVITQSLALALFGAALGSLDVAMNAHGVAVEARLKRPVMSAFHGWYSAGAAIGAALGGVVIDALGVGGHALAAAGAALAMLAYAWPRLLPASVDQGLSEQHFAWPTRATLALGALAFLALLVEGAMLDWSALHLTQNMGASVWLAGLAFAAFSTGMAVVRFAGDSLRMRVGAATLVRLSALALAVGLAAAIAIPSPPLAVLAFAVAGLGVGNIAPVLFAGGGRAEPEAPGRGVAAVTTLGYSGFLLGPPLIGMVAGATGLQAALSLTILAALAIAAAAGAARAADGPGRP